MRCECRTLARSCSSSDFGLENEWVGICHAVMSRIAPGSRIIDLSHFVEPLNVEAGARLLADSLPYLPADAVLLAVVDPNVGKDRDLVVESRTAGLRRPRQRPALDRVGRGGRRRARDRDHRARRRSSSRWRRRSTPVTSSVPPRRIWPPACRSSGSAPPLEPGTLAVLELREPQVEPGKIRCEVIDYNRFGNIQLNVRLPHLAHARLGEATRARGRGPRRLGRGTPRRHLRGFRARRVRGDLRPARLADDRPRQPRQCARGPPALDRRPDLDHRGRPPRAVLRPGPPRPLVVGRGAAAASNRRSARV